MAAPAFPISFAQLPSGQNPLSLFDDAFRLALGGAYDQWTGVIPGAYGDATHVAKVTVGANGLVTAVELVGIAGIAQPTPRIITAAGGVVVAAGDALIVLNKAAPSSTAVTLPTVASRNGLALQLLDWAGNAGDITLTPNGAETIMGLANATLKSQAKGLGSAAAITIYPSTDLNGWYYVG